MAPNTWLSPFWGLAKTYFTDSNAFPYARFSRWHCRSSLSHTFTCFLHVNFKFRTLSHPMRTVDVFFLLLFFSFDVQRAVNKTPLFSAGWSSPLQFLYHCPWEMTLAVTPHMKVLCISFQGSPDHTYLISLLLWTFVEVLPSSLFSSYFVF